MLNSQFDVELTMVGGRIAWMAPGQKANIRQEQLPRLYELMQRNWSEEEERSGGIEPGSITKSG